MEGERPAWQWAIVLTSVAAAFFVLLHLIDDLSRAETGTFTQFAIGVTVGLLAIVWLLAITLSLRQEPTGYGVVMVLGILGAYLAFDHIAGLSPSLVAIAETSGVFYAWVIIGLGIVSVLAIVLASYGLVRDWSSRGQEA